MIDYLSLNTFLGFNPNPSPILPVLQEGDMPYSMPILVERQTRYPQSQIKQRQQSVPPP